MCFQLKRRSQNITHCYSYIMWVVLAVFPHSEQPKIISISEPPTMTHSFLGDGRRREKVPACLFWMLHWRGGFPCLAWMTELPHKTWQLLTPTLGRVCLCLFVIYWCLHLAAWSCVFACWASDLPAQDVGLCCVLCLSPSGILYICLFIYYIWMHTVSMCLCVHARSSLSACMRVVTSSSTVVKVLCSCPPPSSSSPARLWWLPETSALHSVSVTRVSSLLQARTPQRLSRAYLLLLALLSGETIQLWTEISFN